MRPTRKPTRKHIAGARRQAAREQRRQLQDRKRAEKLTVLLDDFIRSHYGDPSTGRHSAILTGPVIACLQAAASLRALLITPSTPPAKQRRRA